MTTDIWCTFLCVFGRKRNNHLFDDRLEDSVFNCLFKRQECWDCNCFLNVTAKEQTERRQEKSRERKKKEKKKRNSELFYWSEVWSWIYRVDFFLWFLNKTKRKIVAGVFHFESWKSVKILSLRYECKHGRK